MNQTSVIIEQLNARVNNLGGRIFIGAAPEKARAPFAVISSIEKEPIRTIHGVVGCDKTFEVVVVSHSSASAEQVSDSVIDALDRLEIQNERCYFVSSTYEYYHEQDLHGYLLKFKF